MAETDEPSELPRIITTDRDRTGMRQEAGKKRVVKSRLERFVCDNWMSTLLLLQAVLIWVTFGLSLATQSGLIFVLYLLLLLLRWINYPLAVYALFHDDKNWLAVIAGIFYTLSSLSGKLLVAY